MRLLSSLVFAAGLLVALASLGCVAPVDDDRTVVAALTVVGSVDENTCGSLAVSLPDPWTRAAELSRGAGDLYYWREVASGVVVQGALTNGEYRFRGSSEAQILNADPSLDYPGCRVRLDDELRFTLEGDESDAGADGGAGLVLTGRQSTVVSVVAGSNCAPALNSNGGNFLALPCEFAYDLEGGE